MKFKDALLKIKKEGLLDCIVDESNDYEVCSSIEKEIDSLLSLEPCSSSIESIVCVRFLEYIKLDRDKSTFKSHRDFSSEIEITFKHF